MNNEKLLGKLAALLRKAEETDNEYESVAYIEAAQRIATASSLNLAIARQYHNPQGPKLVQEIINIGIKGTKGLRSYVLLFVAIAQANDVHCDVLRDSTTVFAFGYDSDIQICHQLYQSLLVQMVTACQQYLISDQHKNSVHKYVEYQKSYGICHKKIIHKPVPTITARLNFQMAYAERIGFILQSASHKEASTYEASPEAGALVLLAAKTDAVTEYYCKNTAARGRWSPQRSSPYVHSARQAGNAAAKRAKIARDYAEIDQPRQKLP